MALQPYSLRVRDLGERDQYKDMVRVHWSQRGGVGYGSITRVTANAGKPHILAMRGCVDDNKGTIGLDHLTRDYMKLINGQIYEFTFEPASLWEKLSWARQSADPAARVATWIAIISGGIGAIGILLSIVSIVHTW